MKDKVTDIKQNQQKKCTKNNDSASDAFLKSISNNMPEPEGLASGGDMKDILKELDNEEENSIKRS
ncbi:hypothetical protein C942_04872 [Photobacterium marinum]|uniref:Uncharacterized protein n=1 Tax=Photobacterium marinum TaxID=1056511 RepID=L8J2V0_9GAMM|nr:hypothetical protein [Photobacterium marinum]ELR63066.1 hypothetical protein C942_04872 [Photobacterium marinum]